LKENRSGSQLESALLLRTIGSKEYRHGGRSSCRTTVFPRHLSAFAASSSSSQPSCSCSGVDVARQRWPRTPGCNRERHGALSQG